MTTRNGGHDRQRPGEPEQLHPEFVSGIHNGDSAAWVGSSFIDQSFLGSLISIPSSTFDTGLTGILPVQAGDSLTILGSRGYEKYVSLQKEIDKLKGDLLRTGVELREESKSKAALESQYRKTKIELERKEKLKLVLGRVHENAIEALEEKGELLKQFTSDGLTEMAVLSVDIRKSTELMLNSRDPSMYASFITNLCRSMTSVVLDNYGVFDKFTGDGILALFPVFFSGDDAVLHAVRAAALCHMAFEKHYVEARSCFYAVKADVGLGIGIDFGPALLTSVSNDLTAVGIPIVYACRLSDKADRCTLLNEPAKERLLGNGEIAGIRAVETVADLKYQGAHFCHKMEVDLSVISPGKPFWWKQGGTVQEK